MSSREAMIEEARKFLISEGYHSSYYGRNYLFLEAMADFAINMLGDQEPATTTEAEIVKF